MKVIDLLNKIANGEEVPKEIKINMGNGRVAPFTLKNQEYINHYTGNSLIECLNEFSLNGEVEIIEEEKDIEELPKYADCNENTGLACGWTFPEEILKNKINELIREVNKLKNKE